MNEILDMTSDLPDFEALSEKRLSVLNEALGRVMLIKFTLGQESLASTEQKLTDLFELLQNAE